VVVDVVEQVLHSGAVLHRRQDHPHLPTDTTADVVAACISGDRCAKVRVDHEEQSG
jgi:hypothetical protein